METLYRYVTPPSSCGYLPDEKWRLEYEIVRALTPADYERRLQAGWRRFGNSLFRPRCAHCSACQSLRVIVEEFRPNRSQRRVGRTNEASLQLRIGQPAVSRAKLDLYDRYHAFQTQRKGWPPHPAKDADSYANTFVDNPFATEEWCFDLNGKLVGVGYVDALPGAMSAIYFFYEPALRERSLGTWNVLQLLEETKRRGIPHLYLGYYVVGCASMEYKGRFVPNEILGANGRWRAFRS
jgi:arginyl-tRNA--protein-N-Asp/Glu arginylyltransferase